MDRDQPGSDEYRELEQLLSRIESSASYYQLFAIPRTASTEDVKHAYEKALALFHLCYSAPNEGRARELRARADQSMCKLSDAYTVLSNYGKRVVYDNMTSRRLIRPVNLDITMLPPRGSNPAAPESRERKTPFEQDPWPVVLPDREEAARTIMAGRTSPKGKSGRNRRRAERSWLSVPAYVLGHDRKDGKWREVARTRDVSRFGASLEMRKRLPQGLVVQLSLPLPAKLRSHGLADAGYNTFAIVRRVGIPKDGFRLVGVEFLGEKPPEGYLAKPWSIYRTGAWHGPDRRRAPREKSNERITVEYLDESKRKVGDEIAQAENISSSGLRIIVSKAPSSFDYLRITRHNSQSLARVCHRYLGADQVERLCLSLIEVP